MDKVHGRPVDLGAELGEAVQASLAGAPVEPVRPVLGERPQVLQVGTLRPAFARCRVRPSGLPYPRLQVVNDFRRDIDRERVHGHRHDLGVYGPQRPQRPAGLADPAATRIWKVSRSLSALVSAEPMTTPRNSPRSLCSFAAKLLELD